MTESFSIQDTLIPLDLKFSHTGIIPEIYSGNAILVVNEGYTVVPLRLGKIGQHVTMHLMSHHISIYNGHGWIDTGAVISNISTETPNRLILDTSNAPVDIIQRIDPDEILSPRLGIVSFNPPIPCQFYTNGRHQIVGLSYFQPSEDNTMAIMDFTMNVDPTWIGSNITIMGNIKGTFQVHMYVPTDTNMALFNALSPSTSVIPSKYLPTSNIHVGSVIINYNSLSTGGDRRVTQMTYDTQGIFKFSTQGEFGAYVTILDNNFAFPNI